MTLRIKWSFRSQRELHSELLLRQVS
jgi:hypothetical protein